MFNDKSFICVRISTKASANMSHIRTLGIVISYSEGSVLMSTHCCIIASKIFDGKIRSKTALPQNQIRGWKLCEIEQSLKFCESLYYVYSGKRRIWSESPSFSPLSSSKQSFQILVPVFRGIARISFWKRGWVPIYVFENEERCR